MKKTILTIVALVLSLGLYAQNIVVQSFRLDETDLTANTAGTIVIDQNGQKCALIKIETTQTGFSFDTGLLMPQKVEQHPGEVWVYLPEGVKRITISHPQLGILRDHDLGMMVKRAKTYIMKLTTGEVQTVVKQARTSQFVVFQLTPANAVVRLDGSLLSTTDGTAMKYMPFGTYDYMVEAPDYQSEAGKVTVNDPKNKHVVNVRLKPNFSQVTLTVDNNAEIWVNGEKRGSGQWTGNLGAGVYMLEARLAGHRPTQREATISVAQEPQTIRLDAPTPIFGEASIVSSPAMADVVIDGKKVGQTPLVLSDLLVGQHKVKISKQGYTDYEGTLIVSEGQTADLAATLKKQENINIARDVKNKAQSITAISSVSRSGTIDGHDYVDLGLPSGTLWATSNIGATRPEEFGDYFAWGETKGFNSGKTDFSSKKYAWCKYKNSKVELTKYCAYSVWGYKEFSDTLTELEMNDDAACMKWGGKWRIPSIEQFQELINTNYTTTDWMTYNGVCGRLITSKSNGNTLFLPAAGIRYSDSLMGASRSGYYWSRTLFERDPINTYNLRFYSTDIFAARDARSSGQSVRPVCASQ